MPEATVQTTVDKDTMIGQLLMLGNDKIPEILMGIGMHCLGCPSSQYETIEQAAMVHMVEPQDLVDEINRALQGE